MKTITEIDGFLLRNAFEHQRQLQQTLDAEKKETERAAAEAAKAAVPAEEAPAEAVAEAPAEAAAPATEGEVVGDHPVEAATDLMPEGTVEPQPVPEAPLTPDLPNAEALATPKKG